MTEQTNELTAEQIAASNKKALEALGQMFDKVAEDVPFFSQSKFKSKFSIDDTAFAPNVPVGGGKGKGFEAAYQTQLEKLLRPTDRDMKERTTVWALIALTELHTTISKGGFPIAIWTQKHRRMGDRLTKVWNEFYAKNITTINQLSNMVGDGEDISALFAESDEVGVEVVEETGMGFDEALNSPQPTTDA